MKLIVFQHADVEHPGVLSDFLREDGVDIATVELDEGETIPDLDPFDAMLVMGGPQDVWQEDDHPWLRDEKDAIYDFVVRKRRPFVGICLGHQLLADAIGGRVAPSRTREVGVLPVSKTIAGEQDVAVKNLPDRMQVLQWHSAEVCGLPEGATILAQSELCPIQAFRYLDRAYGFQFHVEVGPQTVGEWAAIPVYAQALEEAMGEGALARLDAEVAASLARFNADARTLYDGLKETWNGARAGEPQRSRASDRQASA